jgi:lipopolysaccharide/colanic/teichoic acid biosynthesis glycosyltransferase
MSSHIEWLRSFDPNKRILTGRSYRAAKRTMDLSIVLLSAPFWLPILGAVALAIKLSAWNAPVFFVQLRTGKGGRRFRMFKFRSMVPDAEKLKSQLAAVNASGELAGPLKLEHDPRITRLGRILRKTSLDELPQLINIISGDMSLVGPRPTSWSPESYKLWHTERLDVLPGITGLWQVFGRGSQDFDDWLRWDIQYIEKRSLWFDFVILIKTFTVLFKQRGAR